MAMRTRVLGRTGLPISVLGLGSWAFGGHWVFGWGEQDDAVSAATIGRAMELGINWIDTAPVYGLGHAETVIGRALSGLPRADRPLVFTKCGVRWSERGKLRHDLGARSIRDEVHASLGRLGVEAVDLYQIHRPDFPPGGPAERLEEGWETLHRLRDEGKVRHIGVSNFDVAELERAAKVGPVETLQPPYSLMERSIEEDLLPYCDGHGVGVITYSPLQSGLLSGGMTRERLEALSPHDWRKTKSLDFREPRLGEARAIVARLEALGDHDGATPAQLAIAWVLRRSEVAGCIVGARRPEQIEENVLGATLANRYPE